MRERKLARALGAHESPYVAHHGERVLVHRVDVEQVVLHLAHDPAEDGEVGGEHSVAVHAAELGGEVSRLAQDLHEQRAGAEIASEILVDEMAVVADEADCRGAHAFERRALHEVQEDLQQGEWVSPKDVLAGRLDEPTPGLETLVDRFRLTRSVHQENGLLEELQQHFVQPIQLGDGAIVALHELLDRQRVLGVTVVEKIGQRALVIEEQPVLATIGKRVKGKTDAPEELLTLDERVILALGKESVLHEIVQRGGAEMAFGDPTDHLDIAQAAGPLLDIGLEVVGRVVEMVMPSLLLLPLRGEELSARPDPLRAHGRTHGLEEIGRAREDARLHEIGCDGNVAGRLVDTVGDGASAVADLEPDIPEERDEGRDVLAVALAPRLVEQDHEVDVGTGQQLAAAVAADGDERDRRGAWTHAAVPGPNDELVDQSGAPVDELGGRRVCAKLPP